MRTDLKECSVCKQSKPLFEFYKRIRSKDGFNGICKKCVELRKKTYKTNSKEVWNERYRKSGYKHLLKKVYGVTLEWYEETLNHQDNRCAICGKYWDGTGYRELVVDHDHVTNKVRALLCFQCNNGLGAFKDNTQTLENAIAYLGRYRN